MTSQHSRNSVLAKARKRMARPAPDFLPLVDYAKPVAEIIIADRIGGRMVFLQLYQSPRRRDAFRVLRDGREWKRCIGSARMGRGIGLAIALGGWK